MPINSLAMAILADYKAVGGWNKDNWIGESLQHGLAANDAVVGQALAEGWAWLDSRALVAKTPSQSAPGSRFVTRLGEQALDQGVTRMEAGARLGMQLHPGIVEMVERQFLLGEYDLAVLAALRSVEVRVRQLSGLGDGDIGTKLMQSAFNASSGPLRDADSEPGEQVAMMKVFKGAIGLFKNPSSHRIVDYDDSTEAAEIVLLADLLHRILDRIEQRFTGAG